MFLLAGYLPLNVLLVHRTVFSSTEEAAKFLEQADLNNLENVLKPMTLAQVSEHSDAVGLENVQLVPQKPLIPEEDTK